MGKGERFMKSYKNRFVLFLVSFVMLAISVSAYGQTLSPGEATGTPGTEVKIPITLTTAGVQISATANDIGFNTALLDVPLVNGLPKVELGPAGAAAGKLVVSSSPSPGVIRIGVLGFDTTSIGDGIVASLFLTIKATAPQTNAALSNAPSASNSSGASVPITGTGGVIHIHGILSTEINLGPGSGAPGGSVTIPLTLVTNGQSVSATSNDFLFNPALLLNPRAAVGPAASAAGKQLVSNVVSPGVLRVGVLGINNTLIGDGILANLTFDIAPSAALGSLIPVDNTTPSAADPNGNPVPVVGADALITVRGLGITTTAIPPVFPDINGFAGRPYSWPIQLDGGLPPLTWSIAAGSLPTGVTLNPTTGVLSGTPVQSGTFPFTVKVVDANRLEGLQNLSLKINLSGDLNGDGTVAINELQIAINSYLGVYPAR